MDDDFRYGQLAIEGNLITPEQFDAAMTVAEEGGKSLADVLVKEGAIDQTTADRLTKALRRIVRDERAKSEGGLLMQKQIGGYRLIRRIGEGGMGEVYLAQQLNMHRKVALKVLHPKWSDDEEFRKRFLLEARSAGKLSHQHLIQVYDVGKFQGKYYFSMEYVDGVTVEDLIDTQKQMSVEKTVRIARQVCEAIKYLGSNDIVHRDIKPANIMMTKDDVIKLGDFGFIQSAYDAELMQEGTTLGTPDYISPEQARGERNLDIRSDIYSLGATMFHMLSGKTVFGGSCSSVMRAHLDSEPPDLREIRGDVPDELVTVLAKMLAKSPDDRHESVDALISDLDMISFDSASGKDSLPASRSQMINVLTAEKKRIEELEKQVKSLLNQRILLLGAAVIGWVVAVALLTML